MQQDTLLLLAVYNSRRTRRAELIRLFLKHGPRIAVRDVPWGIRLEHWRLAHRQLAAIESLGIEVIAGWRLAEIWGLSAAIPPLLFVCGAADAIKKKGIGVVGARKASVSLGWAYEIGRRCSVHEFPVVSGGAVGVDAAAHWGAVDAKGLSVAYLGVAIDGIYPCDNRDLFEKIVSKGGALASEHAPGIRTLPYDHANRNRFITLQSKALVIAEASVKSGTLRTAQWAHRLGVPVWVSPNGVGGQRAGLNHLIQKQRARILDDPNRLFCG